MWDVFRGYVVAVLFIASSIGGVLGVSFITFRDASHELIAATLVLGAFCAFFLADSLRLRSRWQRQIRYADMFEDIGRGFKEIHNLARRPDHAVTSDVLRSSFCVLCDAVADAYTFVSGRRCHVCIKVPVDDGDDAKSFETLARSRNTPDERLKNDRKARKECTRHTIPENTAFQQAHLSINNPGSGFLSNQLPWLDGYVNTSFQLYSNDRHHGLNPVMRWYKWPLPYKSTIVVPIYPLHAEVEDADFLGFLCIDSPAMFAFDSRYDAGIARGIADGIYNTLLRFHARM